jgi:DNA ligase D-like protein (predicted 3'-phosphoesterase)
MPDVPPSAGHTEAPEAYRATVRGRVQGVGFRESVRHRALELALRGWVRNEPDGTVEVHAEGPPDALALLLEHLRAGPPAASVTAVEHRPVRPEGHEQFAIRGVAAGLFVVRLHAATTVHFDLRLQVGPVMRSWAVPKGPSLDPAVRRLAVQVPDHPLLSVDQEAAAAASGAAIIWDHGPYEQGGRVAWPEALDRGHAVFVLHGVKLRGGFALQRTGPAQGDRAQWLLLKRRDGEARPGSDIVSERPEPVA